MKKLTDSERLLLNEFLMSLYHWGRLEKYVQDKIIEGNQLQYIKEFEDGRR